MHRYKFTLNARCNLHFIMNAKLQTMKYRLSQFALNASIGYAKVIIFIINDKMLQQKVMSCTHRISCEP